MSIFTTRVELHNANWTTDYETLHAAMAVEGFTRTTVKDKVVYNLPTAEYSKVADLNTSQVLELAKKAATKTGKRFSVLVSNCYGREFYNLDLTPKK
jgi:hypothetical protein